jgi:regulator of sirC expression with transglutaminase-like and TPR domain
MVNLSFREEVHQTPLDVAKAALCFAQEIAYPRLEVVRYLDALDSLVVSARQAIPAGLSHTEQAVSLAEFLFVQEGFRGNHSEYHDPRNSFLNDVLDRRLGIPISLSVIYLHIGLRLGYPVSGVGMPGHFIVCVRGREGSILLDPFNGGVILKPEDCIQLVRQATGYNGAFDTSWLRSTKPAEILARMLNNLRGIYIHREDWQEAVAVVERLRIIRPESADLMRDLGLLFYHQGSLRRSIGMLDAYLRQSPDAADASQIRDCIRFISKELASLN